MYGNKQIKIGTCANMYYLRADQRHLVRAILPHNVDPSGPYAEALRFRFPFPDEDGIAPGAFEDYDRGVRVNIRAHDLGEPCPGMTDIVQQKPLGGLYVVVCRCTVCGTRWREETWRDAMPIVNAMMIEARRYKANGEHTASAFQGECAIRVLSGYKEGSANVPGRMRLVELAAKPWCEKHKTFGHTCAANEPPANDSTPEPPKVEIPTDPRAITITEVRDRDHTRFGKTYPGSLLERTTVKLLPNKWVAIRKEAVTDDSTRMIKDPDTGRYATNPNPTVRDVVRVFRLGDAAEVHSYNLVFTGHVRGITAKTVTCVEYEGSAQPRTYRMSLYDFVQKNWDFDQDAAEKRNANWSD